MAEENNVMENESEQVSENELRQIRLDKLQAMRDAGFDPFTITTARQTHHAQEIWDHFEQLENQTVCIAGRMMSRRDMGKANFIDISDRSGRIQVYVRVNDVGEETFAEFKKWDIGDLVEVEGFVFRTRRGEISVHAQKLRLLSKSLLPLPEKFHGLKDTDSRYRRRYLDLIMNPEVKDTFVKRSAIISSIRRFLEEKGFVEVETPTLNTIPGGATARPFITHHNTLDLDLYLRIAPELYLKRLIVGGMERVFEIGRMFRNEGMDVRHNPEFTLMELYQAYTDYNGMMEICEQIIRRAAQDACGTLHITYQGEEIDLETPFTRMTMLESIEKYTGVDFNQFRGNDAAAREAAKKLNVPDIKDSYTWGKVVSEVFEAHVEDKLVQPTFILDYPVEVSPLTKKKPSDPALTERFEVFITRREFGNAYSELNDPIDQLERFKAQMALRDAGDDEANMLDSDFVTALEYGMPPTGGLGMGMDRLVMLLTDSPSIRDVLLFPTMKPLNGVKEEIGVNKAESEAPKIEPEKIDFSKVEIEPLFKDFVDFETFSKSDFRAVKVLACEAVPKSKKLLKFTLDDGSGENRTILSGIHAYYEPEELVGKTCVAITNLPPRKMMGIDSEGMLISAVYEYDGREGLNLLMLDDGIPAGAKR